MTQSTPKSRTRKAKTATALAPAPSSAPKGKIGDIVQLLRREEGARLDELMTQTGWQAHSVRGAIAGSIKKKLGLTVSSEKTENGRVYRIAAEASA